MEQKLEVLKIPARITNSGVDGAMIYVSPKLVLEPLGWKVHDELELYKTPDGHLLIKRRERNENNQDRS